jgi:hypothetical protein
MQILEAIASLGFQHDQAQKVSIGDAQVLVADLQEDFPKDLVALLSQGMGPASLGLGLQSNVNG